MEVENTTVETETTEEKQQEQEKTFTQAELDSIITERLNREKTKYPTKEEMSAYREWKKTQTKEEPQKVDNTDLFNTKSELELYKLQAKPEFMEFLISKISAMGDNFKENAEKLKTDNPQYFIVEEQKKRATAPRLNNSASKTTTSNDLMNNLLRGK